MIDSLDLFDRNLRRGAPRSDDPDAERRRARQRIYSKRHYDKQSKGQKAYQYKFAKERKAWQAESPEQRRIRLSKYRSPKRT